MTSPGSADIPGASAGGPAPVLLPGAERVLAAQGAALPQPDQLCGPFAAWAALHALAPTLPGGVPSLARLAAACGTRVWPQDDTATRPPGEPPVARDRADLPRAASPEESGTDAPGLRRGVEEATGGAVAVVSAAPGRGGAEDDHDPPAPLRRWLATLARGGPVGVVAHVRTGPVVRGGGAEGWDVGHFVAVWALLGPERPERLGLADSYASLGQAGLPPGCRVVSVADLDHATRLPPGRGLLLLVPAAERAAATAVVRRSGLEPRPWSA